MRTNRRRPSCVSYVGGTFQRCPVRLTTYTRLHSPSGRGRFTGSYQVRFRRVQSIMRRAFLRPKCGLSGGRTILRPSCVYRTLNVRKHLSCVRQSVDDFVRVGSNGTSRFSVRKGIRPGRGGGIRVLLCVTILRCDVKRSQQHVRPCLLCAHCPLLCPTETS